MQRLDEIVRCRTISANLHESQRFTWLISCARPAGGRRRHTCMTRSNAIPTDICSIRHEILHPSYTHCKTGIYTHFSTTYFFYPLCFIRSTLFARLLIQTCIVLRFLNIFCLRSVARPNACHPYLRDANDSHPNSKENRKQPEFHHANSLHYIAACHPPVSTSESLPVYISSSPWSTVHDNATIPI